MSGNLKGKKEPAIQKLDKESTASAKAGGRKLGCEGEGGRAGLLEQREQKVSDRK